MRSSGRALVWITLGLVVLVVSAVGGALVATLAFRWLDLTVALDRQPLMITIPEPIEVGARIPEKLRIFLDHRVRAKVPINQELTFALKDTLHVKATFDGEIPIRMNVTVDDVITIDQVVTIDSVVEAEFFGGKHWLPLRGKIPVKANVPVKLQIPVDQMLKVNFTAPVDAEIDQRLTVPLVTTLDAVIPLVAELSVPVRKPFAARVTFPPEPVKAVIDHADLALPLRTLEVGFDGGGAK